MKINPLHHVKDSEIADCLILGNSDLDWYYDDYYEYGSYYHESDDDWHDTYEDMYRYFYAWVPSLNRMVSNKKSVKSFDGADDYCYETKTGKIIPDIYPSWNSNKKIAFVGCILDAIRDSDNHSTKLLYLYNYIVDLYPEIVFRRL